MRNVEITIYTGQGAVSYTVKATCEKFKEAILAGFEKGFVTLETIEGSLLIINPMSAAAVEISDSEEESDTHIPPV